MNIISGTLKFLMDTVSSVVSGYKFTSSMTKLVYDIGSRAIDKSDDDDFSDIGCDMKFANFVPDFENAAYKPFKVFLTNSLTRVDDILSINWANVATTEDLSSKVKDAALQKLQSKEFWMDSGIINMCETGFIGTHGMTGYHLAQIMNELSQAEVLNPMAGVALFLVGDVIIYAPGIIDSAINGIKELCFGSGEELKHVDA